MHYTIVVVKLGMLGGLKLRCVPSSCKSENLHERCCCWAYQHTSQSSWCATLLTCDKDNDWQLPRFCVLRHVQVQPLPGLQAQQGRQPAVADLRLFIVQNISELRQLVCLHYYQRLLPADLLLNN